MKNKDIYIVFGVSGCGKSTIGKLLAHHLNIQFLDGDDFHPAANIKKMSAGIPLQDEDRKGWLEAIHERIKKSDHSMVIACSALKEKYRSILKGKTPIRIHWIFLNGKFRTILERLKNRRGHFMPDDLLQSQFDALELPTYGLSYNINLSPEEIVNQIIQQTTMKSKLGLIGLGVMGKSLARNFASKGVHLSLYNRYVKGKEENVATDFIQNFPELNHAVGFEDLNAFVNSLAPPRKIFMMISAGGAVDATIESLIPLLDIGDLIIDGGNSHYKLTQARNDKLKADGIFYIGTGVSGGEEGALKGPSIMPGGEKEAYVLIQQELESIAAKDKNGNACCGHIGKGGAGHFVKMVHNGIEYAEMQLIAECYGLLKNSAGLSNVEISDVFDSWNTDGGASSYLLEITIQILRKKENELDLIDIILDKAGNKGTGSWTTIAACELGVPVPTLTAALFARYQSSFKANRINAEAKYQTNIQTSNMDYNSLLNGYQMARIINHHQGIHLIAAASQAHSWDINMAEVARIWTNGCIIRSEFMEELKHYLKTTSELLLHPEIIQKIKSHRSDLSDICGIASKTGNSSPCFQASLSYLDMYIQSQSTANIIQGQRDFFGAHRYQRKDDPSGNTHHTIWNS
ncbi:MAG: NADP-dependent phosphogluconate dehydrogenase [Saprospiraceae bacterium]|nr:NADP-dependent phosphogluconate dehydrogenase [Saprospiraceae bacterium]